MRSYHHAPEGYDCPFCRIAAGDTLPEPATQPRDVVYRNRRATAFVANKWWPDNRCHVLVVPNRHLENLYEMPSDVAGAIHQAARWVALAMKAAYACDGISTRQHNEPDGDQEVWHYHLHVFPRYRGDNLYRREGAAARSEDRVAYAQTLREWIERQQQSPVIRPLRPDDTPPWELWLTADPSRALVEGYVNHGHSFVAEQDGAIVGTSVLVVTRPGTIELVNLAVAEPHQGLGLGKRLVEHAIATARAWGFRTIEVGTGNPSLTQLELYQRCGFRIVGVDWDFFPRHYPEPIYENGLWCRDMIRLSLDLSSKGAL